MSASTEIENLRAQIANQRKVWNGLAAAGKHAEAEGVENEIKALERSSARYEVQQQAEQAEYTRLRAVAAAKSTHEQIERHRKARADLEAVVAEMEAAAKAVDAAWARLGPSWMQCRLSFPSWERFDDPALQDAYDDALGADRNPAFNPLRLGMRLPLVLDILRQRGNRGLNEILSVADARF